MVVLPLYFIVLFAIGTQLPLAKSTVADHTAGIPDLAGILPVVNRSNGTLPLADVRVQVTSNALALAQLQNLLTQLLRALTLNPTCSEEAIATHVAQAMIEGFGQAQRLSQHLLRSIGLLKLTSWRIDLVRSMGVAESTPEKPCPLPFFMRNNKCMYVEMKAMRSFRYAKMECRAMGGSLIEPHDLKDFAEFINNIGHGRDSRQASSTAAPKEVFVGGVKQEGSETWQWLSGNVIENIPWDNKNQTDGNSSHCLCVKGHRYKDTPCENLRFFACERPI